MIINKNEQVVEDKENKSKVDIRVAVVGNVDSGKSSLIGVLTSGERDDGRGLARRKVFAHQHEASTGRTSYCSQHILGFDATSNVVHQPVAASASVVQKNKSWRNVVEKSRNILTLVDLAGHEKYLKTTIAGLTGCYPDYSALLVGANNGVTMMTREHMGVVAALSIPVACVITKIDICPENVFVRTKKDLFRTLKRSHRKAFEIKCEKDLDVVFKNGVPTTKLAPIFCVSCVTGEGLDLFIKYLSKLQPRRVEWTTTTKIVEAPNDGNDNNDDEVVEFSIDEDFQVPGVGLVVSGTVITGTLNSNTTMYLGPFVNGKFHKTLVKTIHCKRTPVNMCHRGTSCAIAIKTANRKVALDRSMIRKGMVLLSDTSERRSSIAFQADIMIMHHATSIKVNYEAVVHVGMIRNTATLVSIDREYLRSGDKANVIFRFVKQRPEFLHVGSRFIFREGATKGVGKIRKLFHTIDELDVFMKTNNNE